jgi:hypothetical protein
MMKQKKYYLMAIEKGNKMAEKQMAEYIKTEKNIFIGNIKKLTTYKNISVINVKNECLICNSNTFQYMINTKCNDKYDHYYCLECFEKWYTNDTNKCVACTNTLSITNFCLTIYQK